MTNSYAGFLSYAHADEDVAARLHKALETYKIPKGHSGKLSPIFRDTNELTAHHSLSEKIQGAVEGSRVLIVLCSPAAKASHWVNEEIRLFRKIHGEAAILCVLAEGTPETAFPTALLEGGREPLAANLGTTKSSFQLGVTQIAAAMLGVGLDTLIQRDARRKRRRLQAVTVGALLFSGLMGATTFSAVTAQKAAETNRMQAEGLIEYMITDLKEKLEPVGRLDILDGIGQRAVKYYDAQDISKLPDDSLARQAKSRHILGQVALDAVNYDKARIEIEAARRLTQEVYKRNPEDTDAIFAHAQSEYWAGEIHIRVDNYQATLPHWIVYSDLSEVLFAADPTNIDWIMERGWAANNLAFVFKNTERFEEAKLNYIEAIEHFELASKLADNDLTPQKELANTLAGLAKISLVLGNKSEAFSYRQRQQNIYEYLLDKQPDNILLRWNKAQSLSIMITDGFLDTDKIALNNAIDTVCVEYDFLVQYDPNNLHWQTQYSRTLSAILRHSETNPALEIGREEIENRITELQVQ